MSYKYINKLPTPEEIKALIPLSKALIEHKRVRDASVKAIFEGKDDRLLVIIGPCSADDEKAVLEYTMKLAKVQERVKEKLILMPRVYTNKPRTTGEGYKGIMHQPDPSADPNISKGIQAVRQLHVKVMAESGLTAADEMLYPNNYPYLDDVLSYVAVGARSVENQQHRLTVSGMDVPAGMKNPTSGDLPVTINSIKAAQLPHTFIYNGHEVETTGNPLAHAMLRGAVNQYGRNIPNYHYEDLLYFSKIYLESKLQLPSLIVDTNHANSMKRFDEQPRIAMEVLRSMHHDDSIRRLVKGFLIESYLLDGRQDTQSEYGKSITDACLGWEKSEDLIYRIADSF
ncbi:MAG: 3-deoxy-7-phosphoheptulonate synthase [Clostridiales bacterium]|jgi:3-deoxy-7-phosphoheptulonate synthase|nr:3-deoxy-7-phosphoheptulonate synthase [Clostridiales bacterium]MDN5300186.1 3-deoxy-7-phosphoheptulonate synthase [Clostridiales bacterium]